MSLNGSIISAFFFLSFFSFLLAFLDFCCFFSLVSPVLLSSLSVDFVPTSLLIVCGLYPSRCWFCLLFAGDVLVALIQPSLSGAPPLSRSGLNVVVDRLVHLFVMVRCFLDSLGCIMYFMLGFARRSKLAWSGTVYVVLVLVFMVAVVVLLLFGGCVIV